MRRRRRAPQRVQIRRRRTAALLILAAVAAAVTAVLVAARGWPGVLNLKLEALEQGELSDEMVEEMLAAGWELGSHTVTHADLAQLSGAELRREVAGSRRRLERRFEVPVDFFCYSAGSYDEEAVAAVRSAGYRGATTTEPGLAAPGGDRLTMPRLRVGGDDGAAGLAATIEAAQAGR